jgi:S1-C subfamily serine protease
MQKKRMRIVAFVIVIGFTGCVEIPLLTLDNESRIKLREEVKTFNIEELQSMKYKQLAPIEGIACSPYISSRGDVRKEDALDELRYRSKSLGGNGIVNVVCSEPIESFETSNCGFRVTCNAVAIQIEPIGYASTTASERTFPAQSVEQQKKGQAENRGLMRSPDAEQPQAGVVKITAKPPGATLRTGTGFIVRLENDAAYVVTAAHVVAGDPQPKVEFFTKRNLPVPSEVLGVEGDDEVRGLALLVVRGRENLPKGLRALPLAETMRFSGGEDIIMIGFPGNAGPWNVVKGNISSRQGRDLYFSPPVDSGHSGGPILQNGKVVGIVAAAGRSSGRGVIARSVHDYVEGFGVTVQDHDTLESPDSLVNVLTAVKVQELTSALRDEFEVPTSIKGLMVNRVDTGTAAEAAGVQRGDVITEINRTKVSDLSQYHSIAGETKKDEMIVLRLNRKGNELIIAVQP